MKSRVLHGWLGFIWTVLDCVSAGGVVGPVLDSVSTSAAATGAFLKANIKSTGYISYIWDQNNVYIFVADISKVSRFSYLAVYFYFVILNSVKSNQN